MSTLGPVQFRESLFHCRQAVERVQKLVATLQDGMTTRKRLTSWKMALQREERSHLLDKLDRARADLLMAYTILMTVRQEHVLQTTLNVAHSTHAEQKRQVNHMRTLALAFTNPPPPCEEQPQRQDIHQSPVRRNKRPTKAKRFTFPGWACNSIWQLAFQRAAGQWTVSLTMSRDLRYSDEICAVIEAGDVQGLQSLLRTGRLSVHDTLDGFSLLSVGSLPFKLEGPNLTRSRRSCFLARSR